MRWLVSLRPAAERDVEAARDWYEQKRFGLGNEFLDAVAGAMAQLETDPNRERLYYRDFRRVLLRRFPYKVFYQIVDSRVIVFRVLHGRQSHEHIAPRPPSSAT